MRPLKLKMYAFGPYKDLVEIDFEKLGSNGIFLITGDTGSGKTTIFDAISFALFGVSSGSRRENSILRSDFVSDDVKTFVELEFIHKNILYKIERKPKYVKKKSRGSGVTNVLGDATLTYLNEIVTGEKNVTEKCIEVLGITAIQFKQIVMIAQGEFMDLLLAKSKDRAIIFRKIFNTVIYKDISDILKEKYLVKKRKYEDELIILNNYKKNIIWDKELDDDILYSRLLEILKDYNNISKKIYEDLKNDKLLINKEYDEILEKISEASLINESIKSIEENKIELNNLLKIESSYLEKKVLFNKNKEIIERLLPNYNELVKLRKNLNLKKQVYKDSINLFDEISEKYEFVSNSYKGIYIKEKKLEDLNKKKDFYNECLIKLKEIEDLKKEMIYKKEILKIIDLNEKKKILEKFKDRDSLLNELDKLEEKFKKLKKIHSLKNKNYVEKYEEFLNAQVGIIASNLKDNEACPVCGSLEHPKPAVLVDSILTKEEINELKNEIESISNSLENSVILINNLKRDIDFFNNELNMYDYDLLFSEVKNMLNKFDSDVDVTSYDKNVIEKEIINIELLIKEKYVNLDNVNDINNKIDRIIIEIDNLKRDIDNLKNDYLSLEIKRAEARANILNIENDIINLESEVKIAMDRYEKSYKSLGFIDEKDYLDVMLDKEDLVILEKDINDYKNSLIKLRSSIDSLEEFLGDKKFVDVSNLIEKKKILEDKRENNDVALKELNYKLSNNLKVYNQINNIYEKINKLESELMIYKDLSDTANGNIIGKNKLEFEQYVQANYFDRVICAANKRFSYMTDDRYLLVRKKESSKVSDKLGLELQVIDNYTGKNRDVKSLSGGESFKAALSLALGMSDTIQEFSGGVVVDSMFIDEGFGNLDDESLESAMNAIMMLGQSDKLIGIISHVSELKQRIDKKVVVKKSNCGSSVEIVF